MTQTQIRPKLHSQPPHETYMECTLISCMHTLSQLVVYTLILIMVTCIAVISGGIFWIARSLSTLSWNTRLILHIACTDIEILQQTGISSC